MRRFTQVPNARGDSRVILVLSLSASENEARRTPINKKHRRILGVYYKHGNLMKASKKVIETSAEN